MTQSAPAAPAASSKRITIPEDWYKPAAIKQYLSEAGPSQLQAPHKGYVVKRLAKSNRAHILLALYPVDIRDQCFNWRMLPTTAMATAAADAARIMHRLDELLRQSGSSQHVSYFMSRCDDPAQEFFVTIGFMSPRSVATQVSSSTRVPRADP